MHLPIRCLSNFISNSLLDSQLYNLLMFKCTRLSWDKIEIFTQSNYLKSISIAWNHELNMTLFSNSLKSPHCAFVTNTWGDNLETHGSQSIDDIYRMSRDISAVLHFTVWTAGELQFDKLYFRFMKTKHLGLSLVQKPTNSNIGEHSVWKDVNSTVLI